jgi:hypothetical protein
VCVCVCVSVNLLCKTNIHVFLHPIHTHMHTHMHTHTNIRTKDHLVVDQGLHHISRQRRRGKLVLGDGFAHRTRAVGIPNNIKCVCVYACA